MTRPGPAPEVARAVPGFAGLGAGHLVSLVAPTAGQMDPRRVAHGLSRIQRFNGSGALPFSIGMHSVVVGMLVDERTGDPLLTKAALLHDAHETVVGDIILPLKQVIGRSVMERIEEPLDRAIGERFGIDPALFRHPAVKAADIDAVYSEALLNGGDLRPPDERLWVPRDFVIPSVAERVTTDFLALSETGSWRSVSAFVAGHWLDQIACCDELIAIRDAS